MIHLGGYDCQRVGKLKSFNHSIIVNNNSVYKIDYRKQIYSFTLECLHRLETYLDVMAVLLDQVVGDLGAGGRVTDLGNHRTHLKYFRDNL